MERNQETLAKLLERLELLLKRQQQFSLEVNELRKDIQILKNKQSSPITEQEIEIPPNRISESVIEETPQEPVALTSKAPEQPLQKPVTVPELNKSSTTSTYKRPKQRSNWEKFIGENLINKIGILITVIGVIIGAKYSIEHNLINPLTRIVLGYVFGLGLLGVGVKLKATYENYSAVLLSGALAIMYFITFAAYNFYALFPQSLAFGLMLLCTVFGVTAALHYNRQVIAHIGLVGAYAIPFLVSTKSGNPAVLFSYMAIINVGIVYISLKKYWKALYYSAFGFTWGIFTIWRIASYETDTHFQLALLFIAVFFFIFYATFLGYKLIKSEKFKITDILMLLLNSFIFYGLGYGILADQETGKELLGIFTLGNAIVHFVVCTMLFKRKLADKNLFYLVAAMVLTFVTIAIPVQLDGNWVTLLWLLEGASLFWIGRTKKVYAYEYMSYPLLILSFLSLLHDWSYAYTGNYDYLGRAVLQPVMNSTFLTSLLCIAAFGCVTWLQKTFKPESSTVSVPIGSRIMSFILPALLLCITYFAFYLEIDQYWALRFEGSEIKIQKADAIGYAQYDYSLNDFKNIWLLNYTLFFITVLAVVTLKKIKNRVLGIATLAMGALAGFMFLTSGLYILSDLRQAYINSQLSKYYTVSSFSIGIRYLALSFFALLWFAIWKLKKQLFAKTDTTLVFELLLHICIIWVLSSELLHWMDILKSGQSYKLGLSILWGLYSLLLIVLGIWKKKKFLRVGAIVLFGITLLKLFFYDIASLNTIAKTIVFVSLGVLLLLISFLYNKYKHIITDEDEQ